MQPENPPDQKPKPNTLLWLIVTVFVVLGVLAGIVLFYQTPGKFKYELIEQNTLFASNEMSPTDHLQRISEKATFVVTIPYETGGPNNSYYSTAPVLFNQVLAYKTKKVILVVQELDSKGNQKSCQTNFGDTNQNQSISLQQCSELLNASENVGVIEVQLADNSLVRPRVVLEKNHLTIQPKIPQDVAPVSFLALKAMYSDAASILNSLGELIQQVKA